MSTSSGTNNETKNYIAQSLDLGESKTDTVQSLDPGESKTETGLWTFSFGCIDNGFDKYSIPNGNCLSVLLTTLFQPYATSRDMTFELSPNEHSEHVVMVKVVEFLNHYHGKNIDVKPKPVISADIKENMSIWDAEFLDVSHTELIKLLEYANFWNIPLLIHVTSIAIACGLVGKPEEYICEMFGEQMDNTDT